MDIGRDIKRRARSTRETDFMRFAAMEKRLNGITRSGLGIKKSVVKIVGNGSDDTFSIDHGLDSLSFTWSVYKESNNTEPDTTILRTSTNSVDITFTSAPSSGEVFWCTFIG